MTWIVFLAFFWISESSMAHYVKGQVVIENCSFANNIWNQIEGWYSPIVAWIFLALAEYLGYRLNRTKRYDNIKWVGGKGFNMLENILVRCLGWYMFCLAYQVTCVL
jgi:hypothetical protein